MNKIQISLLIVSLWVISCSSGPKETKESPAVVEGTSALPEVAPLPVTFLPVDSLTLFPDAILELNTPLSNQVFKPGKVPFEFNIKNFSLKTKGVAAPRLLMILNGFYLHLLLPYVYFLQQSCHRLSYCSCYRTQSYRCHAQHV